MRRLECEAHGLPAAGDRPHVVVDTEQVDQGVQGSARVSMYSCSSSSSVVLFLGPGLTRRRRGQHGERRIDTLAALLIDLGMVKTVKTVKKARGQGEEGDAEEDGPLKKVILYIKRGGNAQCISE